MFHFFYGSAHPFSNFHGCEFTWRNQRFHHAEQAIMYAKALLFGDAEKASLILATKNPVRCKQLGRGVKPFDGKTWDQNKRELVFQILMAKASQNERIAQALFDTGDAILAEASPRDRIWGIGFSSDHPDAQEPSKWGQNVLGEIWMRVRKELPSSTMS